MKNLKPEIQIYTVRRVIYLLPQTTCHILHTSSYKMRIFIGSELSTPFFPLHESYGDQIQQMGKTNGSNLKQLICQKCAVPRVATWSLSTPVLQGISLQQQCQTPFTRVATYSQLLSFVSLFLRLSTKNKTLAGSAGPILALGPYVWHLCFSVPPTIFCVSYCQPRVLTEF